MLSDYIITKRIDRFVRHAPADWGDGWEHVTVCSTCEDQTRADPWLLVLLEMPLKYREVISEPILDEIHIEPYLRTGQIKHVTCGEESGSGARPCDFLWVQELRRQCIRSVFLSPLSDFFVD